MFGLTAAKQNTQIKKLTLLFIVCCIFAKILVYHAHSSGSLYTRLQTLCKNQASHPNRCHLLKTTCAAKRKPAGYQRVSIKWSGERGIRTTNFHSANLLIFSMAFVVETTFFAVLRPLRVHGHVIVTD